MQTHCSLSKNAIRGHSPVKSAWKVTTADKPLEVIFMRCLFHLTNSEVGKVDGRLRKKKRKQLATGISRGMILGNVSCETGSVDEASVPSGWFKQVVSLSPSVFVYPHHSNHSLFSCPELLFSSLHPTCLVCMTDVVNPFVLIYGLLILSSGTVRHYLFLVVAKLYCYIFVHQFSVKCHVFSIQLVCVLGGWLREGERLRNNLDIRH